MKTVRRLVLLLAAFALASTGCATRRDYFFDADHPSFKYSPKGLLVGREYVQPDLLIDILEDNDIPKDRTIHILVDAEGQKNLAPARMVLAYLAKHGYRQAVLVTEKHSTSESLKPDPRRPQGGHAQPTPARQQQPIRYRRASE